jgi:hypothetical protein
MNEEQINSAKRVVEIAQKAYEDANTAFNNAKALFQSFLNANPGVSLDPARYKEAEDQFLSNARQDLSNASQDLKDRAAELKHRQEELQQQQQTYVLQTGALKRQAEEDIEVPAGKNQRPVIGDLTAQLKSFTDVELKDECLQSPNDVFLPYLQKKIKKMYVRKCYQDVFNLLLENIGKESFAISGTPGIGKSLFFVYILHRLIKDCKEKTLALRPNLIVYQHANAYTCFYLQEQIVTTLMQNEAAILVREKSTFYVIDGHVSIPLLGSCVSLFISSPRSDNYKDFVKQKVAKQWYFPVWTLEELQTCWQYCYSDLLFEPLKDRYRIYGGIARWVFEIAPNTMEPALADVDAVRGVRSIGIPTNIFTTTHTLLHIIVSSDGCYQFTHVDIASKYVGEQLWQRHSAQMLTNLRDMFGGSPSEISRHLFEIYGHTIFSTGGQTLKCKSLEDAGVPVTEITLADLNGHRFTFGKDTIPTAAALTGGYYEPTDDDNFPAVDSLSSQGMFQFTVAAEHPIRGVSILRQLSSLYAEPKLYFVVPRHRFEKFKKQSFKSKHGKNEVGLIAKLKQYVIELPV